MTRLNRRPQTTTRDTHHSWFIRQRGTARRFLCALCDERMQMVTLGEAATAARVEPEAISALVRDGKLHSMRTEEAELLICLNSLITFRTNGEDL